MQFLKSILSSIDDGPSDGLGRSSNTSLASAAPKPRLTTASSPSSLNKPTPPIQNGFNEKRKAESQLHRFQDKALKPNTTSTASTIVSRLERTERSGKPPIATSKTSHLISSTRNGGQTSATATATSASKAPPKKGSFAEIMARAEKEKKAAAAAPLGVIKHKPKEKMSAKKEILMRKKGIPMKGKEEDKLKVTARSTGNPSTKGTTDYTNGKSKPKPAPVIGYTGTAKPKPQLSYKGTMKPEMHSKSLYRKDKFVVSDESDDGRSHSKKSHSSRRRDLDSEDEEAYGLDEEEDFDSGAESSDMEAGFSDVEEEDERAARLAREEDQRELNVLDQKKREKEERRRRIEAVAAKNRRR